ncbi:hypothetical protein SGQ83_19705 [Flavobacterium sp. Fl-318]|uniref:Uncharacterized protein n=1 Tax=Flavobacterium cupriresistens TaxID=2893885 RepID=A0ABU4RJA8_9FLAO|nr:MULTISPECIES: hypothetical protein [unclassified Flavobacterium]MDX6191590.1 hypothetical protein [Flavobacterium sp. Fl-318]UFH41537.1 hypothetical protein LNP23_17170 [Flavobacterium sp. F-323]
MRRYNPYVFYKGKLAIKDSSLYWFKNAKGKLTHTKEIISQKIANGEIIRVKNTGGRLRYGLLDYDHLRYSLKEELIRAYGLPPKIINE